MSPGPGSYNIPSSFSNLPIYAKWFINSVQTSFSSCYFFEETSITYESYESFDYYLRYFEISGSCRSSLSFFMSSQVWATLVDQITRTFGNLWSNCISFFRSSNHPFLLIFITQAFRLSQYFWILLIILSHRTQL